MILGVARPRSTWPFHEAVVRFFESKSLVPQPLSSAFQRQGLDFVSRHSSLSSQELNKNNSPRVAAERACEERRSARIFEKTEAAGN